MAANANNANAALNNHPQLINQPGLASDALNSSNP